jgi:hypothetical protein
MSREIDSRQGTKLYYVRLGQVRLGEGRAISDVDIFNSTI